MREHPLISIPGHDHQRKRIRSSETPLSEPSVLLAHLCRLSAGIDGDHTLEDALRSLVNHLGATVGSYSGLQLTVTDRGGPVTLTEFSPGSQLPASSLAVPLAALVPAVSEGSRMVFFAAAAGAFVDLAADLSHALGIPTTTGPAPGSEESAADDRLGPTIQLDGDLPPPTMTPGIAGLEQLSTINRAIGLLLGRGHLPEDAHDALRRGAAAADLDIPRYAARLLGR